VWIAALAAALYAVSTPFAKLLLKSVDPVMMAAFLYLGAGIGTSLFQLAKTTRDRRCGWFSVGERPYVVAMVLLDVLAPILLMLGLKTASAANVSLLNNFEIVATSIIALAFFGERISRRLWLAIALITLACLMLSVEDVTSFAFSVGSLFVLGACVCWGIENNCTRRLADGDAVRVVIVKGFGSGLCSLVIALAVGERIPAPLPLLLTLLLGVVAYGMSIVCYVRAQRALGAARTSAYYALAPFIGAALSFVVFRQMPGLQYCLALSVMIVGAFLAARD